MQYLPCLGRLSISPGFGTKAPISTATAVQGRKAKRLDSPIRREELVYGPDGVSLSGLMVHTVQNDFLNWLQYSIMKMELCN